MLTEDQKHTLLYLQYCVRFCISSGYFNAARYYDNILYITLIGFGISPYFHPDSTTKHVVDVESISDFDILKLPDLSLSNLYLKKAALN